MINEAMFSSNTAEWATPQAFFDKLNDEFDFTLDPCATPENAKCVRYYTKEQDGLSKSWRGERVFCNPPYGREISKWIEKASREVYGGGCSIAVLLIPARTDTKYFHDYIYGKAEIRFIRGRLHFNESKTGAPFPSMLVIFRDNKTPRGKGDYIMSDKEFIKLCKKVVCEYANKRLDKTDGKQITEDDVFIVWCCKTLQNNKALASTTLFDGMYYELTYNGDKAECYVDAYKKWENFCVDAEGARK